MSNAAIELEQIGKRYALGERSGYRTIREVLASLVPRPSSSRSGASRPPDDLWALRDVSFRLDEGEVLGLIGTNGAGKSTLLKILAGITRPTEGRVTLRGRVGSLLEVGTGFHPELSGRENVFLNGAILGMSRGELRRRFDEIVAFSGVEAFLDTPVKHYSSGMRMRLAFAVAAHLEPEILLVDEVLAVGDAEFQRRCLGKIGDIASGGRTVVLVSHNLAAIGSLCERAVWLHAGQVAGVGPAREMVSAYLQRGVSEQGRRTFDDEHEGSADFRLLEVRLMRADGTLSSTFADNEPVQVELRYALGSPEAPLRVGVQVSSAEGQVVFQSYAGERSDGAAALAAGVYTSRCEIPAALFNEGSFLVGVNAGIPNVRNLFFDDAVLRFEIQNTSHMGEGTLRLGVIRPQLNWRTEPVADA